MIGNVIVIIHQPVTDRILEDFFVKKLEASGIKIEFYDLTQIFHPELITEYTDISNYVGVFKNLKELETRFKANSTNSKILYIPYFIFEFKVLQVYRLLTKYRCKTAFMGRGMVPYPHTNKSYIKIFISRLDKVFDFSFYLSGFRKIYTDFLIKTGYIKGLDYIFNAGNDGYMTSGFPITKIGKVIPFNSTDYSRFLKTKEVLGLNNRRPYAVFIDEYLPYHPDTKMLGIDSVPADKYYSKLRDFFDFLELKYNLAVIVAAHPKSNYQENPFGDREVIKGRTEMLVKDCSLVIDHFSTAISYAILNKKPLLIITTDDIDKTFPDLKSYSTYVAEILDAQRINVDRSFNFLKKSKINEIAYNRYISKYLSHEDAMKILDEDLFLEFLKKDN